MEKLNSSLFLSADQNPPQHCEDQGMELGRCCGSPLIGGGQRQKGAKAKSYKYM